MMTFAPDRADFRLIAFCLLVLFLVPRALVAQGDQEPARETLASRPVTETLQQDDVAALRGDQGEWWEIKDRARLLWEKKENQAPMVALLRDPGLRVEVFTGLAVHLAAVNERIVISTVMDAIAERDLGEFRETIARSVIGVFHRSGSVMSEVDAALERLSATPGIPVGPGFARVASLMPILVEVVPPNGGIQPDAVRYQAIERLLTLWAKPGNASDPSVGATIRGQLFMLAGGLVELETAEQWKNWFKELKTDNEREQVLSLQRIGQESIRSLKARIEELAAQRRREVNELFGRMKDADVPPTNYLLDSDAVVRRNALRTLREMRDTMAMERRLPAVQELISLLQRPNLDDDRRRTLLDAAGAIGRRLPEKERRDLAAGIFTGPEGLGPDVWRARLAAIAEIGAIDDPARLEGLYDLANSPGRAGDAAWIEVREDVIRACATLRLGLGLLLRGLGDAEEKVRGIAASTLAVEKSSWTKELAGTLVAAAVAEQGADALTRMLEALRNIGRERTDLLDRVLLGQLIGIQDRASDANDARILGIILHAGLSGEAEVTPDAELVDNLLRNVFAGGASAADRSRLVEQILSSERPLAVHLLGVLMTESPAALDHAQTDRAVALVLAQQSEVLSVVDLVNIAGRISGRPEIPIAHRSREAARLAGAASDRINAGESAEGLDLAEFGLRLQNWRLASGDAELIALALADLDARVAEKPEAPDPLLRRAAFFESLYLASEGENLEFLAAAEADLRGALSHNGAMDAPTLAAVYLRLATSLLLQAKFTEFAAEVERAGPPGDALLLRHIAAVLTAPGQDALTLLDGVTADEKLHSPQTYELLRVAAGALSRRVGDRLAVSDALKDASADFLRELDGECRSLRILDELTAKALAGSITEEEKAKLSARPKAAAALVATRLLTRSDEELRAGVEAGIAILTSLLPEVAPQFSLDLEGEAALLQLRSELKKLTSLEVDEQKRPARFLKLLGRALYSP